MMFDAMPNTLPPNCLGLAKMALRHAGMYCPSPSRGRTIASPRALGV